MTTSNKREPSDLNHNIIERQTALGVIRTWVGQCEDLTPNLKKVTTFFTLLFDELHI